MEQRGEQVFRRGYCCAYGWMVSEPQEQNKDSARPSSRKSNTHNPAQETVAMYTPLYL
jgi:hypothetical protein